MDGNDQEVAVLIQQARTNREMLGRLLDIYRPFLLIRAQNRISRKLAARFDPSDVVQQTLAEAHKAFPAFCGASEPEFSVWITRIHDHNVLDLVRQHARAERRTIKRQQPLNSPDGSASFVWQEPAAEQSTPSQHLIKGEKALRLAGLLQSLPENQREAVRLRHLEGRPVEEIAEALGRSVAATAGLIKRGLKALRVKLAEESWF